MQKNYNENLVAGAAIRDDKGRRISKLFEASHPKMTVGYAKNLIMPDTPTEQEFNFRQAGGGVIEDGVAVIDKVNGNSVVWNQKVPYDVSKWRGDVGSMTIDGSVITLSCGSSSYVEKMTLDQCIIAGHKYYTRATIVETAGLSRISLSDTDSFIASDAAGTYSSIKVASSNADLKIVNMGGVGQGATFKDVLFVDLTQMFGAGNEPSTVEEFLQRKPKVADEYAYNEGTIVNNKVEKVVTTGRNLFDSSTAIDGKTIIDDTGVEVINSLGWCSTFIPIIGGKSYFCKGVTINIQGYGVHCYDKDKQHINGVAFPQNGRTFDAPINAKYIRISGRYDDSPANAAILNLSDASFNGQYAPYEKHELDLSWIKDIKDTEGVKLFEDGMRSVGTAFDEVGKNKAVKRLGSVDLGTLPWNTSWWDNDGRLYVDLENKKVGSTNVMYPLGVTYSNDNDLINTIGICGNNRYNTIYVGDAKTHSSASEFISSLRGVIAYYELAEPIEVEYDEKSLTYPVVAGGTEEAIASEPTATFHADIGYGIDAVKTILDLKARVEALEAK